MLYRLVCALRIQYLHRTQPHSRGLTKTNLTADVITRGLCNLRAEFLQVQLGKPPKVVLDQWHTCSLEGLMLNEKGLTYLMRK